MRDLLFRNLTSPDRRKRVIAASEVTDNQGVRSVVHRHFIYLVKEIQHDAPIQVSPYLFALRERNSKELKERFFCKIKGGMRVAINDKLFIVYFVHTINICLHAQEKTVKEKF